MSEREQQQHAGPIPEEEGERPNPGGDPKVFLKLVSDARGAADDDRARVVGELIDVLVAMRAPGNERAEAKAVLGQLDLKSLTGLVDRSGRSARAEAVQTVLTLGFPYALEVSPQDLDFAREKERSEANANVAPEGLKRLDRARKAAAALAGTSAVLQGAVVVAAQLHSPEATVITAATATATAGWAMWMASRVGRLQRDLVQGAAGIVCGVSMVLSLGHPDVIGVVGALAALPILGGIAALSSSRAAKRRDD